MSFVARHNKGSKFNIDTTGFQYMKPAELVEMNGEDAVYTVAGLYINTKGSFGDQPAVILPEAKAIVNLPSHMLEEVIEILGSQEDIDAINAGAVGLMFERYESKKYHRECLGVKWIDL